MLRNGFVVLFELAFVGLVCVPYKYKFIMKMCLYCGRAMR